MTNQSIKVVKINASGETADDVCAALELVSAQIRDGYTSGSNANESGFYDYSVRDCVLPEITESVFRDNEKFQLSVFNMATYGGAFAKAIASAALCADSQNRALLISAFFPLFKRYLEFE